ncbi:hypothetical protein SBA4_2900012 [Candidatus Sulfopaludibacter sp. SbA4]|nr:hypothetical protein SBA4_2900012 [Candidatus Sulfopaludibacter sp. SbA4]
MTGPAGDATEIAERSGAETLGHPDHAGGEIELGLFVAFPVVRDVAVGALHTEVATDRLHPAGLILLRPGAWDDADGEANYRSESGHGGIIAPTRVLRRPSIAGLFP